MEFYQYNQYAIANAQDIQDKDKADELKVRLLPFASVETLADAQKLAKEILPTNQVYTSFYVGNAKCSVVNKPDSFRISVDTADEFICYDFS